MWLNVMILSVASLSTGFVLGWVAGRPKRWYTGFWADARPAEDRPPWSGVSAGT
ncbi:MAG: hypothetical protein JWO67_7340 [Streptosporangiaceae bacterium]|jgi:hypothetical protein|nr:hypothetical protein [Streptosporangiaceae bacterium]